MSRRVYVGDEVWLVKYSGYPGLAGHFTAEHPETGDVITDASWRCLYERMELAVIVHGIDEDQDRATDAAEWAAMKGRD